LTILKPFLYPLQEEKGMTTKKSGKRLNYLNTREGSSYTRVKKSLKKTVTRAVRRKLNKMVKE
jgi:hypothetical protein